MLQKLDMLSTSESELTFGKSILRAEYRRPPEAGRGIANERRRDNDRSKANPRPPYKRRSNRGSNNPSYFLN